MRNFILPKRFYFISIILLLSTAKTLIGQQTVISDYVMFSGNGGAGTTNPGSLGYGVIFGSSSTITNGAIGSYSLVKTTGNSSISSNIFSGGKVILANGSTVSGRITAANSASLLGTIFSAGSNAMLTGNIDVKGNIVVSGGSVTGTVTHPAGTTYTGPTPSANIIGTPSLPTLPALPPVTSFPASGSANISTSQAINPGSYGNVTLSGNKTLTFNGPGIYVFNSINLSGNNSFVYNFQNLSSGTIKIYVYGDAILAKLGATITNGGSASRIFLETHGTGSTSASGKDAVTIANGSNGGSGSVKFLGTAWAPYAAIAIGSGTGSSQITGTLYSGTQVVIQTGVSLIYSPFSECSAPVANAGPDVNFCSGGNASLGSAAISGNTYSWSPTTGLSSNTTSNPTVTLSASGTTTYTVTVTSGTCVSTDQVNVTVNALPDVHAGSGYQLNCSTSVIQLNGSSSTPNAHYSWVGSNGGNISANANTATPTINAQGTFTLTVTNPATGCTASDVTTVTFDPCILPGYSPPDNGKSENIIGSELTSLFQMYTGTNPDDNIFIISDNQVWVEIIYNEGMYQQIYDILTSAPFNTTEFIDNGTGNRIITTQINIEDLGTLNDLNISTGVDLINYVRPVYPPIPTAGVAYTQGDVGQKSDLARNGFKVDGEGIKVGVLSNSYNTLLGNPAHTDIVNGDLPGIGNPDGDTIPVDVVQDYPYGSRTDEGRAMLQIVHDVAPKAELAFRTGFISAGNMAVGIKELQQAGCNVEVDDITYLTEPYFSDGLIAQAIDSVNALGVSYFTSAGNYGDKSYEGIYTPTTAPGNIVGTAHDFGGGDRFMNVSLTPGTYLAVMQWEDDFYSIEQNQSGTQNDLDIYLTYDNGITLFGMNRYNINGDPIEVLSFTVTQNTTTNILVTRASGTGTNVHFKFVFFVGSPVFNEFSQGNSTIVGQANALGAITTGAVLYSNTPPFGVTPTKASFSSIGGTLTYGAPRNKPDICAPNGGNTTVELGGTNIDNDAFPNFFGTSSSAPHAAAIGALLMQAKQKFYGTSLNPAEVRNLLTSSAVDMYTPGFDYLSGYGLVDADAAMRSFAAPTPSLISLDVPSGTTPGTASFSLTVTADYITTQSKIVFRDDTLPTTWIDEHHLSATIPSFFGNPPITVCTPPITPNLNDGGCSNVLYFFTPVQINVVVTADNKIKKYGEKLPAFTATITVNGTPLTSSGYTLADLGLDDLTFTSPATNSSNVGIYFIQPTADVSDVGLQELYDYTFTNGLLTIQKMPLIITPVDKTVAYGDKIDGTTIDFTYQYDASNILETDQSSFLSSLQNEYKSSIVQQVALIDDQVIVDGHPLSNSELENLALICGGRALTNGGRGLTNGGRGLTNGTVPDTTYIIDVAYQSLVDYNEDSASTTLVNGHPLSNGGRGLTNGHPLSNGTALANGHPLSNGFAFANSTTIDNSSNSNLAVIIHESDVAPDSDGIVSQWFPINLITGTNAGTHFIGPAGFLTPNFEVTYGIGHLTIEPYELKVQADDKSTVYGTAPVYSSTISGYQYDDAAVNVFTGSVSYSPASNGVISAGNHAITPTGLTLIQPANYYLHYLNGTLNVGPATLTATANNQTRGYGFPNPAFTISYSGFKFSDNASVISPPLSAITSATISSPAGTYPITISTGSTAANYTIVRVPGTLTINAAPSCNITAPSLLPNCGSTGNTLTASAPTGYTYSWSVSGTGWQITNGSATLSITYTAGGSGTSGIFTFSLYAPGSSFLVSSCSITLAAMCTEYCSYLQSYWSNTTATDCNGVTSTTMLPGLLGTDLVSGDANRKIIISSTDASCMQSKLPSGSSSSQLPNGVVNCVTATGNNYLSNGKFRSNLLGQELSLALSVRLTPALGTLHITGPYITTYAASSCVNGTAVNGTKLVYAIPQTVVTYLGSNTTVADLITLANKGLGSTLQNNAPSLTDIANACLAITTAFDHCRILAGFSQTSQGVRVENLDASEGANANLFIYPNPASDNATVSFVAMKDSHAIMDVYSINGSLISHVFDGNITQDGIYTVELDCSSFMKGMYFVRLSVDGENSIAKLVIIK